MDGHIHVSRPIKIKNILLQCFCCILNNFNDRLEVSPLDTDFAASGPFY